MNDQGFVRPARPAQARYRPGSGARLAQNDMIRPVQNGLSSPAPSDQSAAPSGPQSGTQTGTQTVVPPIPPLPLLPTPYDYNAEGLTMRDLLQECLGHYIVAEHQVGVSNLIAREGRLVRVEANAYVLEEPGSGDSLVCDYYSLKFFRCLHNNGRG